MGDTSDNLADYMGYWGWKYVEPYVTILTIELYDPVKPTNLTPSSGSFPAGLPLTFNWKYNASQSPYDAQTGSVISYSLNNGNSWTNRNVPYVNATYTYNQYAFPANTFPQGATVLFRVMTKSTVGDSPWTAPASLTAYTAKAPNTLQPDGAYRNPGSAIELSWNFVKSNFSGEVQNGSVLRYRVNDGAYAALTLNNIDNKYMFAQGTFSDGDAVTWQVQTISNVGASDWSATASFTLAVTPPRVPILTFPVSRDVNASNGVLLEWIYNSEYDIRASEYDIEYWLDGSEAAATASTDGRTNYTIPAKTFMDEVGNIGQHTVLWRVKAYGEFGDGSEWSDTAQFWTIGLPGAPSVVAVTNSNRPVVTFSAVNLVNWELEILDGDKAVYLTGNQPFMDILYHKLTEYIPNGTYVARIRITNQYGIQSVWGELAFTTSVTPPPAPKLTIADGMKYCIPLVIEGLTGTGLIYRAERGGDEYLKIGKTTGTEYKDYTAAPGVDYKYFVRAVDGNDNYADSNVDNFGLMFLETTLSEASNPADTLTLLYGLGSKPQKSAAWGFERALVQLQGREYPLAVRGTARTKVLSLTYYLGDGVWRGDGENYGSAAYLRRLEELAGSGDTLILRDRRYGTLYGAVTGDINVTPDTGGYTVSFNFSVTDYDVEAGL